MKKFFTLIVAAALAFAAQAEVLSVCQGEYQSGVSPVYGLWYDTPGMTQSIYPADMLADMAGGDITELSFLTLANLDGSPWGMDFSSYYMKFSGGELTLALMEVAEDEFTAPVAMTGATVVATTVPVYGDLLLTFELDEPFHYNGGNLLVEVNISTPGSYGTTYFWGEGYYDENDNVTKTPAYYENYNYSNEISTSDLMAFLPAIDFTYEPGGAPEPPTPTEKTQTPDGSYAVVSGQHEVVVTITPYEGVAYYRIIFTAPDGTVTEGEWMEYTDAFSVYEDGRYRVEFYAIAEGKLPSDPGAVEFTVSPMTGIEEMTTGKTVAGVRYFNMAGQEMSQANGLTIVVTTYTDGTTSAVKVMK